MDEGVEFQGRTVADAIARAEEELSAQRDQLEIEVISNGSRGVFGIGAEPARILARPRSRPAPAAPEPVSSPETPAPPIEETEPRPTYQAEPAEAAAVATVERPPVRPDTPSEGATRDGAALAAEGQEVLRQLLQTMGFAHATVSVRDEGDPVTLAINGDNLGVLIGRRGDNLAALQFMVNLILSKNRRQWPRVVVDVEDYRTRREESLRSLADRIAYRVRRNRKAFTLEAMPASDRRIIHLTLRDRTDVETYSIGEGPARRVVIAPRRGTNPY